MTKRVLDIGNCGPDHNALSHLLSEQFGAQVLQAHGLEDALQALQEQSFDLVTVNRLMDRDGSEGLEIIKRVKADAGLSDTPVMLITNYDEHQQLAVNAGAVLGFGKTQLMSQQTIDRLRPFLA